MEEKENTESAKEAVAEKPDGNKALFSLVGLVAIFGVLFFAYPEIEKAMKAPKAAENEAGLDAQSEDDESNIDKLDKSAQDSGVDFSPELRSWVPLIENQLPLRDDVRYQLMHVRVNENKTKILVDLEKKELSSQLPAERMDLILHRDDFGRYVSSLDELPMKLYPPKD